MRRYFKIFAKIILPSRTPSTTVPRFRCKRTMSADSLAISAAPCTTRPTFASFKAGASLIPSPRNPTSCFSWRSPMMRCFCCGDTRAKTWQRSTRSRCASAESISSSAPVITCSSVSLTRPTDFVIPPQPHPGCLRLISSRRYQAPEHLKSSFQPIASADREKRSCQHTRGLLLDQRISFAFAEAIEVLQPRLASLLCQRRSPI